MSDQPSRKRARWPYVLGMLSLLIAGLVLAFRWDWLIPLVETRASAALGRPVKIAHLHVTLGRTTHVVADGVAIGNPAGWPGGGDFATAEHLVIDVDAEKLIRTREVSLPAIALERPNVDAQQLADGNANWKLSTGSSGGGSGGGGKGPQIGRLAIDDGIVHVRSAPLNGDFTVAVATKSGADGKDQIVASAKGTYAKQPITAEFVGGALLSLEDRDAAYPVDLRLTNGPTTASANGTIADPLSFGGVDVKLEFAGPDMSLLLPLTGVAIPKTPPYRVAGKLDYKTGVVSFQNFNGKVGSSDLNGTLKVDTTTKRPVIDATLQSRMVDLADLGGFIGAEPGDASKGTKRPEKPTGRVLPATPLSLPRLNVADVHLQYAAKRIEGRRQPLDDMRVAMDIVDGEITVHPLSFGIGRGQIVSQIKLTPKNDVLTARADVDFRRVDAEQVAVGDGCGEGRRRDRRTGDHRGHRPFDRGDPR